MHFDLLQRFPIFKRLLNLKILFLKVGNFKIPATIRNEPNGINAVIDFISHYLSATDCAFY
jgi:hypothetical protein